MEAIQEATLTRNSTEKSEEEVIIKESLEILLTVNLMQMCIT